MGSSDGDRHVDRSHQEDKCLVTYRETSAFMKGELVDRDTEKGNRIRSMDGRAKTLRVIGRAITLAAVGTFFGWHGAALLDSFFV